MASGLFRFIAGCCRTMIIANTGGSLTLLIVFMLGGFTLPKGEFVIFLIDKEKHNPFMLSMCVTKERHARANA